MAATGAACDLCGLPAGRQAVTRAIQGVERAFCCNGCANVFVILLESGVLSTPGDFRQSELYRQSLALGLISAGREPARVPPPEAETREALYQLSGLWCASCGWLIEHALHKEYGVVSAEVVFASDLLRVQYCPQYVEPDRIPNRVKSLGYGVAEYAGERARDGAEWRDLLLRLGIAGGLWMNVMLFSLVLYASYFEGISEWARRGVPFILMALATPAVFYSAWPVYRIAFHGLREGAVRMEALVSTGVLAAYGYSAAQAFLGGRHYYFDTACAIITLVLAGKALERAAKEKTARAIAMLYRLMPKKARLLEEGRERFVAIEAIEPGMTILVRPGERIPADGRVATGAALVDESVVTGEPEPRRKGPGDEVAGGSLSTDGALEISVSRAGQDGTLAGIVRSVERAAASRTNVERSVDRVSRIFVPSVMALAAATLAGWTAAGLAPAEALMRGIAVLVIACPCALGIATPLATTAAVGAASRRGILIRDARVLETFRAVGLVVFDKTGTVTEGRAQVRQAALSDDALALVAALESRSAHPLARAVAAYAGEQSVNPLPVSEVAVHPGRGLSGLVGGTRVGIGNRSLVEAIPEDLEAQARGWEGEGLTVAFCALDDRVRGALAFGDRLRPEAVDLVRGLKAASVRTVLLSGDSPQTTARVAAELGVDEFQGGVDPAGKAAAVAQFRAAGHVVAMAGDGINDAPALAAADLGIAMGSGTDLAMQAAPVVLMSDSLTRIAEAFQVARLASRVVRQNLFWAFFYNAAGITLAIAGVLNPILAAAAMVLSSLSVIGNSLRLAASVPQPPSGC